MNVIDDSEEWWIKEMFGLTLTENDDAYEEFIIQLIQLGILDDLFIGELEPTDTICHRFGRKKKLIIGRIQNGVDYI